MSQVTLINRFGKITGWNNLTINFLGRDLEGVTEFEYEDETKMENEYGAGGYVLGQSEGNHSAKASLTVYSEELVAMQKSLPKGTRLQDVPNFPAVSIFEINGQIIKDVVQNCRIMNVGKAMKQGDGKILHKINLLTSHVDWNQ